MNLADSLAVLDQEKDDLERIFKLLLSPDNIHHNTDLTRHEITAFSVLSTLADKYELAILQKFLKENLLFRVSKGRMGRKEWVKIIGRQMSEQQQMLEGGKQGNRWFQRRR